jgi:RNA polymerase sigma-70 factor (ECF subfamily)
MTDEQEKLNSGRFLKLLVPNQKRIHAFILYLVPNQSDAEDILQEALMEMWNKFGDYRDGSDFVAWGVTIAKYKVLSYIQKHKKNTFMFGSETLELLQKEYGKNLALIQDQIDALNQCVRKLSDKEKKYLSLRYEDNQTFGVIANRFGVSIQAVYKAVSRIHSRLLLCIRHSMNPEKAT